MKRINYHNKFSTKLYYSNNKKNNNNTRLKKSERYLKQANRVNEWADYGVALQEHKFLFAINNISANYNFVSYKICL